MKEHEKAQMLMMIGVLAGLGIMGSAIYLPYHFWGWKGIAASVVVSGVAYHAIGYFKKDN